uniref:PHD-type domain-containing protein n=1 Tax=Anopheles minimus TaxID=112268 RepID=A0A182WAM4_9DIPT
MGSFNSKVSPSGEKTLAQGNEPYLDPRSPTFFINRSPISQEEDSNAPEEENLDASFKDCDSQMPDLCNLQIEYDETAPIMEIMTDAEEITIFEDAEVIPFTGNDPRSPSIAIARTPMVLAKPENDEEANKQNNGLQVANLQAPEGGLKAEDDKQQPTPPLGIQDIQNRGEQTPKKGKLTPRTGNRTPLGCVTNIGTVSNNIRKMALIGQTKQSMAPATKQSTPLTIFGLAVFNCVLCRIMAYRNRSKIAPKEQNAWNVPVLPKPEPGKPRKSSTGNSSKVTASSPMEQGAGGSKIPLPTVSSSMLKKSQDKFNQVQRQHAETAKKYAADYVSSEDEEEQDETNGEGSDVATRNIVVDVLKNYHGIDADVGKTQEYLQNLLESRNAVCLICIETVKRADKIWSCSACYTFFHLMCIQRWANDSMSMKRINHEQQEGYYNNRGEYIPKPALNVQWDCPKCRREYMPEEIPRHYECFCGKERDPSAHPWFIPHSCGEPCEKKLAPACGHTCRLLCHPGPCPPCPQTINVSCRCGCSPMKTIRCAQKTWTCTKKSSVKCRCGGTVVEVACGRERKANAPKCKMPCRVPSKCHHPNTHSCHTGECPPCTQPCGEPNDTTNCEHPCRAKCHDAVRVVTRDKNHKPVGPWDVPKEIVEVKTLPHPACTENVSVMCLGGHETADWPCSNSKPSSCGRPCDRLLKCGVHRCPLPCHKVTHRASTTQDSRCEACSTGCTLSRPAGCTHSCTLPCHKPPCNPCLVSIKANCYCGLTQVFYKCHEFYPAGMEGKGSDELAELDRRRESFLSCGQKCIKNFPCGHRCFSICHPGRCPNPELCSKKVKISCKCAHRKAEVSCKVARNSPTLDCDQQCEALRAQKQEEQDRKEREARAQQELENQRELEEYDRKFNKRKYRERKRPQVQQEETGRHWAVYVIPVVVVLVGVVAYVLLME